ncbi:Glycosyltransferase 14 family member [Fasciola hepatica]|uniref:Glycosyltransferase 14 family member n=1 Tax=Fasciola hepatica TaxID=6192 RepID=A0A4E0RM87_FASHE|nr:Glycosyltransferase 14 family member [Fasciola hepatica]
MQSYVDKLHNALWKISEMVLRIVLPCACILLVGYLLFSYTPPKEQGKPIKQWTEYRLIENSTYQIQTGTDDICPTLISKTTNELFAELLTKTVRALPMNFSARNVHQCNLFTQIYGDQLEVSQEEMEFPLAFSFNIHKEFYQFARLFRAVYRHHNSYCIHVDAKADETFRRQVGDLATCFGPNVHVIPLRQSISIHWADFGTVEAWIQCAKFFLKQSPIQWRYMLNGSGQEFPLLTNWELVKALKAINGSNIVESDYSPRFRSRIPKKPLSFKLTWVKGSIYTALRKEMVRFALTNNYAKEILAALRSESKQKLCQDEMFFSTINYNPYFKAPGGCLVAKNPNDSDPRSTFVARYVDWYPKPCLSKLSQREVCIMGVRDIPKLTKRYEFFVNKFLPDFEPVAYDCLEWWLFRKIRDERDFGRTATSFNASFYSDLYCSSNHL